MVWKNREVVSKPDYLLATKQRTFLKIAVRYHCYISNHFIVLGCLIICYLQKNNSYLGGWWRLSLKPPPMSIVTMTDALFRALCEEISRPNMRTLTRNSYISQETWSLIDQCADGRIYPIRDQLQLIRISRRIRDNLSTNWARRVTVGGGEIEALLSSNSPPSKKSVGVDEYFVSIFQRPHPHPIGSHSRVSNTRLYIPLPTGTPSRGTHTCTGISG